VGRIHHERLIVEIRDRDRLGRRQRVLVRDRGQERLGDDAPGDEVRPRNRRPQQPGVDLARLVREDQPLPLLRRILWSGREGAANARRDSPAERREGRIPGEIEARARAGAGLARTMRLSRLLRNR
jgi:hypothetical protein